MPISSQVPIIGYVANGVTKSFAFPFAILSSKDLKVKVGADVVTTGFSIAGVGDRNGGSVTFTAAPASLTPIILYREVTLDRTTDYQENGDLLAIVLDDDLDRVWMALQDQLLLSDRALRSPLGETLQQLPPASERALMALAFDAAGNPIVVRGTNDGGAALALDLMDTAPGKGAALVGYQQAGAGAVARTAQSKLRDVVSVLDFGADPSYATDSTAAFQAAIMAGAFNGTDILVPNGTYRIDGTIFIGTFGGNNCYSVTLRGESTHGSVLLRPAGAGTGPIITLHGFHNVVEKLTFISEVSGGAYSASHGLYIRGNPQANTNGLGTKYCAFRNLKIYRVGVGIQIGNYAVDGVDPDIETNTFEAIEISDCNGGVFANGQNILHNPFYACHIVNCRDYLARQDRGADLWFERSYFGGMYDYLTSSYNVAATSKVVVTAGLLGLVGCRFEDWASGTGNATSRFSVHFSSTAAYAYIAGNTFTTRDNATTEPSCSFNGSGSAGSIATRAVLIDNQFQGYVEINTIDVFSLGNRYQGTGGSVVNGRLLSANQKTQAFRDVFMDSNQTMELPGAKFKRNSSVPVTIERPAVATGSEFLGQYYYDEPGLLWGRIGKRITNGTAAAESSVMLLGNRMAGAFVTCGVAYGTAAPTAGTWAKGDRVFNSSPAVGQPKSWVCTVTGSPGTWVSEGNL